jgi:hypothetical protein
MQTSALRVPRLWVIAAIGFGMLALVAWSLHAAPAHAQDDQPIGQTEVRLTQPTTTYQQPDPNSPVVANLPAGSVVEGIGGQIGADGQMWEQVTMPDNTPLGWMRLSDFLAGTSTVGENGVTIVAPVAGEPAALPIASPLPNNFIGEPVTFPVMPGS